MPLSTVQQFPHSRTLLPRTRLAYIHLRNLLTDAKRDRGARIAGPGRARGDGAATALPDVEIERLAGRVIDSIDRRVAAQRERLGRF